MSLRYFINKSELSLFLLIFMLVVMASNAISKTTSIYSNCYKKAITTIDQRECLGKEYKYYDKILNSRYKILMNLLPKLGKKKLQISEKAWIEFRKRECDFSAFQAHGGTLEPTIFLGCYIEFSKKRISDINGYIKIYKPT